jgi:hypothetical protein
MAMALWLIELLEVLNAILMRIISDASNLPSRLEFR